MNASRTSLFLLTMAVWALPAVAEQTTTQPFVGVTYIARTETSPRPIKMHVVIIDLSAPGISFRVTPPQGSMHTKKQTTLAFLRQQNAQLAINAHFFEPWPPPSPDSGEASLVGIAASDGKVIAPFLDKPPKAYAINANSPGLNIDAKNVASIVHRNADDSSGMTAVERVTLYNTVSGNEQIVTAGKATAADTDWNKQLSARTAIAITKGGRLVLLVVDGRQPGTSEGMKVPEVADLLVRDYQATDAISLDGGGSSTLAMADPAPRVVNVPVGINNAPGTERPVGSNLAIFAKPTNAATASRPATASNPTTATSTSSPACHESTAPAGTQCCPSGTCPMSSPWFYVGLAACMLAVLVALAIWRRKAGTQ